MTSVSGTAGDLCLVTGAFGYSGKYIATRLLAAGKRVRTLTNSPQRHNPFGAAVEAHPYNFDKPDELTRSLEGARVLINTYWVRFDHTDFTHTQAVRNTLRLFEAAKRAGVPRVVHVSITNPSLVVATGDAISRRRPIVSIPPGLGVALGRLVGMIVGDVVVTPEEVAGLMQNLLVTDSPAAGHTALSQWVLQHRDSLGRSYSSELARRRDRRKSYEELRMAS